MITGVVAQETVPLRRGVFVPKSFGDDDIIYRTVITSGNDQRLFPGLHSSDDSFLAIALPQVLTSDAVISTAWLGVEEVYAPSVRRDIQFLPQLYVAADIIFAPDIRIPGTLQPALLDDPDIIFATPLVLDRGMLRAELFIDIDSVFETTVAAPLRLAPVQLASDDAFPASALRNAIGPSFLVSDDIVYNFTSLTDHRASLVIDDGVPLYAPTSFDGEEKGVTLTPDKLTAAHISASRSDGARSTLLKSSGRFYFEVTCGPTHGRADAIGLMHEDADYTDITNLTKAVTLVLSQWQVDTGPLGYLSGGLVVNAFTLYGQVDTLAEFDVIGCAFDLDYKVAWFRKNRGPLAGLWNGWADGNPNTGARGCPLTTGRMGPCLGFGGSPGFGEDGLAGDNFTANFGTRSYVMPPPPGFANWVPASPFPPAVNGDSLGGAIVGLPAQFDLPENATLTNNFRTVTHLTATTDSGATSVSAQNYGKYYFEVTVGGTHGASDCVGITFEGQSLHLVVSQVAGCAIIRPATGDIVGTLGPGSIGGPIAANDVISVAVDLATQSQLEGGLIWFRNNGGNWNGDVLADPGTGAGGLPLVGFNYSKFWVPVVGFGGSGTTVGDSFTANFGQAAFVRKPPNGFAIWSRVVDTTITILAPLTVADDDSFFAPFTDNAVRNLSHPGGFVIDNDNIFATRSFGGNLLLIPNTVVDAPDAIPSPGYLAALDTTSAGVALSNGGRTATVTATAANIGARSRAQQNTGKYYFEVTYGQKNGTTSAVGVVAEAATYADYITQGFNCTVLWPNSVGQIISNGGSSGKSLGGGIGTGNVIGIAIDLNVRRAWFRKDGGLWNNTAGTDPVLGVGGGGVTMASLASFAPAVGFGGGTLNGDNTTVNFGQTAYVNAPPVGFGNWPGTSVSQYLLPVTIPTDDAHPVARLSPANLLPGFIPDDDNIPLFSGAGGTPTIGPSVLLVDADAIPAPNVSAVLATLDGAISAVTLSPDKLTATHVGTTNNAGARSTALKSAGKFYFEVTMTTVHGDSDCCGLLTSTGTFTNFVSTGTNCVSIYRWSGTIYSNGSSSGNSLNACTSGDVISFAIDLTTRKAWVRKNGGNWNGQVPTSQNPNTGLGGVTLNATASYAPAVGFGGANTANADAMTVNFGLTPFAYPLPTNFEKWTA